MQIQRMYIDTSVLGGYFDKEFEIPTQRLFDEVKKGEYKVVISIVTEGELLNEMFTKGIDYSYYYEEND